MYWHLEPQHSFPRQGSRAPSHHDDIRRLIRLGPRLIRCADALGLKPSPQSGQGREACLTKLRRVGTRACGWPGQTVGNRRIQLCALNADTRRGKLHAAGQARGHSARAPVLEQAQRWPSSTALRALTAAAVPAPRLIVPRLGNGRRRHLDLRAWPSRRCQSRQIEACEASSAIDDSSRVQGSGPLQTTLANAMEAVRKALCLQARRQARIRWVACYPCCSNEQSSPAGTGFCHASRARARHASTQLLGAHARRAFTSGYVKHAVAEALLRCISRQQ
ncbi:hypothetical protein CCMA1212_007343 [Trichoderma ghanense]|uniref:Uncharacterized protein n=1 Tax=Trichoderma ghanense TaxID=65468 RepID=A0ABY2GZV7_9HYPO